jgi:hypothetical protein
MWYVYEIDMDGAKTVMGFGISIKHAVMRAAHSITDSTDGAIDHIDNLQCLGEYLAVSGSTVQIDYIVPAELVQTDPIAAYLLP